MKPDFSENPGIFALLGIFYAVGFAILGYALWNTWRSTQAGKWPTTQGTITELLMQETPASGENGATYRVDVRYTYSVAGVKYEGTRIAFGYTASSGRASHQEIFQSLKKSKTVTVHYNPKNHASACLSYGVHRSIKIQFAFALAFLTFITVFALLIWTFSQKDNVLNNNLRPQQHGKTEGSLYDPQLDA